MTNEEIAKSIRKAVDEINLYMASATESPEDHLFSEIDEKLSQIKSFTHYIRPTKDNPFLRKLDRGNLEYLAKGFGCRREELPHMTNSALAGFILKSLPE